MSIFSKVKTARPPYSTFDLSRDRKFSANMGELVPCFIDDLVPGDEFNVSTATIVRMAPMVAPIMHQISLYVHFFFVPHRLLWSNWEPFITGGPDGEQLADPPFPVVNINPSVGSIADYLGLPVGQGELEVSAMPFAAYNLIYNEYYRDQNLIDPLEYQLQDGDDNEDIIQGLQRRAWQHDYFTSALPWTQKGPEATIPLGTTAPLIYDNPNAPGERTPVVSSDGNIPVLNQPLQSDGGGNLSTPLVGALNLDVSGMHFADLTDATAATINDLRTAFRLQEWLERNARGGTRYIEAIKAHFGVDSPDARLQRPEFLGGGMTPIAISEVLQTSSSDNTTPQANMAGHGIGAGGQRNFRYRATEHGHIIGIMSIMPKTAYMQGIPKHFKRFDRFDYYFPEFANLGEQPIFNEELYAGPQGKGIFGYTPRYAEYKYKNSSVHGEFRTTLDFWHMARIFSTEPNLNQQFIECDPTTRIFANETGEQMYINMHHRVHAKRPMPYFGTPTF